MIAKAIHWDPTTRFNEDNYKYFVSLGPLRKEMLGDWVRDSGWVEMLIDADVTSPGRAEVLIKGSHVTWTRYAHQVTALSLSILERMPMRYTAVCEKNGDAPVAFCTLDSHRGLVSLREVMG